MSADAIVYCLEHLTDYPQFERLCSDVMNQSGFTNIVPLGGTSDRGRDALHVCRDNPADVTIFAYSVRDDWQRKLLKEDCQRIAEERHELNRLVFASTSTITTTERDEVTRRVREDFGWTLDLYDIERLRIRLATDLRPLIAQHPAIFCPPFFPTRGGLSISECRDTLVIDHVPNDHALASWLARRLQLGGYRTWCYGTAPLAGETADETVRILIANRALRYLPILSPEAVADPDFLARCSLASAIDDLPIPCVSKEFDRSLLPSKMRSLASIPFTPGLSGGLSNLLSSLNAHGIKPAISTQHGAAIALRSYVPQPVVRSLPENVYANTFAATLPEAIQVCDLARELSTDEELRLRRVWAFSTVSPRLLLCFQNPPAEVPLDGKGRLPAYSWRSYESRYERRSVDVVKELVRRSLEVACVQSGLEWCDDRRVFYFPQQGNPQRNVTYVHVDGRKTRVAVTGEQSYGTGDKATPFRYQLCPAFRVGYDENDDWWVTLRVYIRLTDTDGKPYEKKAITRRRKKVANAWWNKEWFARILGVMQALSENGKQIVVGTGHAQLVISTTPLTWQCPESIDYHAVERLGDFQDEMAEMRYFDVEEDEDEEQEGDAE